MPALFLTVALICAAAGEGTAGFRNPIVPGFHPDPSIVRVGEDYYLANSSFAFFPGVPIHHSRDLVHWRLVGNALTTEAQLPLARAGVSAGIWAPTLRHHAGRFYLVTTNMTNGGNFLVTAKDPAGPWSPPLWIDRQGWDPDLFFDDDGRVYYTRSGEDERKRPALLQAEIDLRTGKLKGSLKAIGFGSGGFGPEGPHLYKIGARYYLLVAEGGTHSGHMVTLFRGPKPWGPFEPAPRNPILTQRDRLLERVQATGHADIVQASDGGWWMVFLGIRNFGSPMHMMHTLGRETFLAPVKWGDDGWPVVNEGAAIREQAVAASLPASRPWPTPAVRDDFDGPALSPDWVFLRNPQRGSFSLTDKPGALTLVGAADSLSGRGSPSFVGRRQQDLRARVATLVTFDAKADEDEAGVTVFYDDRHHYDLALVRRDGRRQVIVRRNSNDLRVEVAAVAAPDGPVRLEIEANPWTYFFFLGAGASDRVLLTKARAAPISTEAAGGFTGTFFGLYATGNGKPASAPARFDWFDYAPMEEEAPRARRQ